jgi:O-antigen/teichoic acid export membrane protein
MQLIRYLEKLRKSNIFETLKHSRYYFLSSVAVRGMGFISLPIMTRLLTPADYGVLSVFGGYQGIFLALLTLNCYVAPGRYYFEDQKDLSGFLGTLIFFIGGILSLFFFFSVIWQNEIAKFLDLPISTIAFIIPFILINVLNSWYEQLLVPQRQSKKIAIRNIINAYGTFCLSIVFILLLEKEKFLGQIYATSVLGVAFSIYYFFELRPYFRLSFDLKHIKYALWYSLPLLPYSLSGVILTQVDRIIINKCSGYTDAGLYSFAYNIAALLSFVLSSLQLAWTPDYYSYMNEKEYQKLDSDTDKFFRILSASALILIFFGKELGMIMAKSSFHSSLSILPIIVIGFLFNSYFTFNAWHIQYAKKNIALSVIVLSVGLLNILLNSVYIPKLGYMAAAFSSCFCYFVMALISAIICRNVLKIYTTPLFLLLRPLLLMVPFILGYYSLIFFQVQTLIGVLVKVCMVVFFSWLIFKEYFSNKSNQPQGKPGS